MGVNRFLLKKKKKKTCSGRKCEGVETESLEEWKFS